jgi:hypothetical protein
VIAGSFIVGLVGIFVWLSFRSQMLMRVGFQFDSWGFVAPSDSEWQGKWLWTKDEMFLNAVKEWRRDLNYSTSDSAALRQTGGRIVLEFSSGRVETYLFHGASRPNPKAHCWGFSHEGHDVVSEKEPFSEFLQRPLD